MWLRVLGIVVLLVTAGCSGLSDDGGQHSATVTPAPVPDLPTATQTESDGGVAPGLSSDGVSDPELLSRSHEAAVNRTAYVWEERYDEEFPGSVTASNVSRSQRVVVENDTVYRRDVSVSERGLRRLRMVTHGPAVSEQVGLLGEYGTYADGDVEYRTWYDTTDGDRIYERDLQPRGRSAYDAVATESIERYLVPEATSVRIPRLRNQHYLVTGTQPPASLSSNATDYDLRAVVRADGFVRSIDVSYNATSNGHPVSVTYAFAYHSVGSATVEEPGWADTARSEFNGT